MITTTATATTTVTATAAAADAATATACRLGASSVTYPSLRSADSVHAASLVLRYRSGRTLGLGLPVNQRQGRLAMNCGGDGDRDISSSALAEGFSDRLESLSLEMEKYADVNKEPSISTILTTFENSFDPYGALSIPLYQTSTFKQPSATENGLYDYTRSGNPTRDVLQRLLAKLEKADHAFCFTSGMAALSTVISLIFSGQEIIAGMDIYGGSDRLLSQVVSRKGIVVKRVDTSDLNEVASAMGPMVKLVWLESPTNPRIQIADICVILWLITLLN